MVSDTGESPGVCRLTLAHAARLSCLSGEPLRVACCPRSVVVCALGGSCAAITSEPGGLGRVPRGVAVPLRDLLPGKPRELTEASLLIADQALTRPVHSPGWSAGLAQVLTQRSEACVTAPGASVALPRCARAWPPVPGDRERASDPPGILMLCPGHQRTGCLNEGAAGLPRPQSLLRLTASPTGRTRSTPHTVDGRHSDAQVQEVALGNPVLCQL